MLSDIFKTSFMLSRFSEGLIIVAKRSFLAEREPCKTVLGRLAAAWEDSWMSLNEITLGAGLFEVPIFLDSSDAF